MMTWHVALGLAMGLALGCSSNESETGTAQLPACWERDDAGLHTDFACPATLPHWDDPPCDCYDGDGGPVFECKYVNCVTGDIDTATCSGGVWKRRSVGIDTQCDQSRVFGPRSTPSH
jgi:hypothetical protein